MQRGRTVGCQGHWHCGRGGVASAGEAPLVSKRFTPVLQAQHTPPNSLWCSKEVHNHCTYMGRVAPAPRPSRTPGDQQKGRIIAAQAQPGAAPIAVAQHPAADNLGGKPKTQTSKYNTANAGQMAQTIVGGANRTKRSMSTSRSGSDPTWMNNEAYSTQTKVTLHTLKV